MIGEILNMTYPLHVGPAIAGLIVGVAIIRAYNSFSRYRKTEKRKQFIEKNRDNLLAAHRSSLIPLNLIIDSFESLDFDEFNAAFSCLMIYIISKEMQMSADWRDKEVRADIYALLTAFSPYLYEYAIERVQQSLSELR